MAAAEKKALRDGATRVQAIDAVRDFFYRGDLARKIADFSKDNGGLLRYEDFAQTRLELEKPEVTTYREYEVYKSGFWTQGPILLQALNLLEVVRIDHGNRALDDADLVAELAARRVPLTVCPLSNVRLRVVDDMARHPLGRMLERGLFVTVNSDDPAYFGGYINDNYVAVAEALHLSVADLVRLARNSFDASLLEDRDRQKLIAELDAVAARPPRI